MANEEHVKILRQGVKKWNQWRKENRDINPDLTDAYLSYAHLTRADLIHAHLTNADFTNADLRHADLTGAHLTNADLVHTDLRHAYLNAANLNSANLEGAILIRANLYNANLTGANLTYATIGETIFSNLSLSKVKGLDTCNHNRPSTIDHRTFQQSGQLPESFLRGCGLSDWQIESAKLHDRSLTTDQITDITYKINNLLCGNAIHYHSCFISYASANDAFARKLYDDLQNTGVRCWFAPEDMKIGDRIRQKIDRAINVHDKLLVILSKDSINSKWVDNEVEAALDKETADSTVLFPIALDDEIKQTDRAWARTIRRTRNIGNFTHWHDDDSYQKAFKRLLEDLRETKA